MNKIITAGLFILAASTIPVLADAASTSARSTSQQGSASVRYGDPTNAFISSWNEARVIRPWNERATSSPSASIPSPSSRTMAGTRCPLTPRLGFNSDTDIPAC